MTVECPTCQTRFPVDARKIPVGGVHVRCSVCSEVFFVEAPEVPAPADAPEQGPGLGETAPTLADPDDGVPTAVESPGETADASSGGLPSPKVAPSLEEPLEPVEASSAELGEPVLESEEADFGPEGSVREIESEEAGAVSEGPVADFQGAGPESEEPVANFQEVAPESEEPVAALEALVPELEEAAREPEKVATEAEDFVIVPEERSFGLEEPGTASGEASAEPEVMPVLDSQEETGPEAEEKHVAAPPPFGRRDPRDKARRLARVLVSDIILYNPDRHHRALAQGRVREEFREEIDKSWQEYVEQVGKDVASSTSFFEDALTDILARGQ